MKMKKNKISQKKLIAYISFGVLCALIIVALVFLVKMRNEATDNTLSEPDVEDTPVDIEPEVPDVPEEPEVVVEVDPGPKEIEWMAELYAENPDIVAWIKIEDTMLDYPVMFTPDNEEKYIYMDFEGNYDLSGLPFIDKDCSLDPESDNIIVYGHNMMNGESFRTIMSYDDQEFYEAHPTISYTTLYEERTYEIVSAFYDRVYFKSETCFKFYQFIDADSEEEFDEAMAYFAEHSCIDTGVTPEYGDNFIMLVTCSPHRDYGRFVVVAREVTEEVTDNTVETETNLD